MNFVDSHCHMDSFEERTGIDFKSWWESADPKPDAVIQVACEEQTFAYTKNLSDEFPQVYAVYGVHPINADDYSEATEKELLKLWSEPKTVGIGEIGYDYHYEGASHERQREVFARQLELGKPFRKTFVLHLRDAEADSLDVLRSANLDGTTLHVHSCTASADFVENVLSLSANVYVGFTGILTFKNAESVREAAARVPLERLLLETDAPYLAPVPFRGKASHAGMIPQIGEVLARVKGVPFETLMETVRKNTRDCYGV